MKTHRISTRSGAPRPNSNPMSFHKVSQWLSRSSQFQSRSLGDDVLTYWDSFGVGANGNGDVCHNLHAVAPAARPASKFKPVLTASSGLAATCLAPLCCGGGCQCRGRGRSTLFHLCMPYRITCVVTKLVTGHTASNEQVMEQVMHYLLFGGKSK